MSEFFWNLWHHHQEATASTIIGIIATIFFSTIFYYIAKLDSNKSYDKLKALYNEGQVKLIAVEKKLVESEKRAIKHTELTQTVQSDVSGVIHFLYSNVDHNISASDTLIKIEALLKQGRVKDAEYFYEGKKESLKGTVHLHFIQALLCLSNNKIEESLALLDTITDHYQNEKFNGLEEVYKLKGKIHFEIRDNFHDAKIIYEKLTETFPSDEYYLRIAYCCLMLSDITKTTWAMEKCKDKESIDFKINTAILLGTTGKKIQAFNVINSVENIDPYNVDVLNCKANLYMLDEKYDLACDTGYNALKFCRPKTLQHRKLLYVTAANLVVINN